MARKKVSISAPFGRLNETRYSNCRCMRFLAQGQGVGGAAGIFPKR